MHNKSILLKKKEYDTHSDVPTEDLDESVESWLKSQELLKRSMRRVCEKFGGSVRVNVSRDEFMYSEDHNLLLCRNAKVGTTTWLNNFLRLKDQADINKTKSELHKEVPSMFPLTTDPRYQERQYIMNGNEIK